ncbi:hypothetical protein BC940DRAFT_339916 [Gongronella butleri]|nr:hypothetical protein BC940DRAFT_339916 [Gongronella butleri]
MEYSNSSVLNFPITFCPGIFACNNTRGLPVYNAKQPTGMPVQLALCSIAGLACFILFCFLRVRWPAMYAPRLNMKKHAPQPLPNSFLGWIVPVLRTPHAVVLEKVGLDAVVMLQFLLMAAKLFGLCGFFGTVVLYPISRMGGDLWNGTNPNATEPEPAPHVWMYNSGLQQSNSFLWVYLFFTYFFCLATFYFTFLNYRDYVRIRQQFMLKIGLSIPSRTVLVTGIPPSLRSDQKLAEYFEKLGIGVVESVHIIRHVHRLLDLIKDRSRYLRYLERAYTSFWGNPCYDPTYNPDALLSEAECDQQLHALSWSTTSSIRQLHKKHPKSNQYGATTLGAAAAFANAVSAAKKQPADQRQSSSSSSPTLSEDEDDGAPVDASAPLLPTHNSGKKKKNKSSRASSTSSSSSVHGPPRPLAKDGFLGVVGKHVDAIQYFTDKFNEADTMVVKARKYGKFLPTSVGFVTFEQPMSASLAAQVLIDSTPFRLNAQLAPEPRDVIWENIAMHGRERYIRKVLMFGILIVLAVFWVVPISIFSALTSESSLRSYFPWLMDLAEKNKILQQIIQYFLPTLSVVIFMAILPMILNGLSIIEGFPTRSEAEESTFSKYFFFLLVNVLLIFSISSALFKTLTDILEDPTELANILATTLPQVSPFFVNYTIIHGFLMLPFQLLLTGPVILQVFHRIFTCKTPRDYAEVLAPRMYNYGWGYPMPVFLFVVMLVYSTVSPLILVFGTIYFSLSYLVVKYQLLYVYFHPYEVAGRMWPLVFSRIIIGLLLFEVLSIGLFVLNKAYTLAVLLAPLVLLTLIFNFGVDKAYQQSTQFLPLQLLSQRFGPLTTSVTRPPTPVAGDSTQPKAIASSSSNVEAAAADQAQQQPRQGTLRHQPSTLAQRRRRTVLDEDDYEAESRKYTDFKEPPMTLQEGILNTGMKRYAHPAYLGVLPQLWLPIKSRTLAASPGTNNTSPSKQAAAGTDEQQPLLASASSPSLTVPVAAPKPNQNASAAAFSSSPTNLSPSPLHPAASPVAQSSTPLARSPTQDAGATTVVAGLPALDEGGNPVHPIQIDDDTEELDDSSLEEDDTTTYYHHPERRVSKSLLSRSAGTA